MIQVVVVIPSRTGQPPGLSVKLKPALDSDALTCATPYLR